MIPESLVANIYWITGIVIGALVAIFVIKYITKKYVIDGKIVQMILNALLAVEDELIALFGENFGVITDVLEEILETLADSQLSEAEAYSLAMTIIKDSCAAAGIELTREQKIIVGFVIKKLVKLIIEYKRPDVAKKVLCHMVTSNVRISSLRKTMKN